jgi:hypothetical protein
MCNLGQVLLMVHSGGDVAYWYPDGRSGDSMICALDFPDEHPYQDRRCAMLTDTSLCGLEQKDL